MIRVVSIVSLLWLLQSCSKDEKILEPDDHITMQFFAGSYLGVDATTVAVVGESESMIENLYVLLFPTNPSQEIRRFYVPVLSGNEIRLSLLPEEAGNRMVYLIANLKEETKIKLDAITAVSELEAVFEESETPWSPLLTTPILMIGYKQHDFSQISKLNGFSLERALAKLELNIALSSQQQSFPLINNVAQYQYRYVNFDKCTYVVKPENKSLVRTTSVSVIWSPENYTVNSSGKVVSLKLSTYLNEQDYSGAMIEISLPYESGGFLPPPEFGDEIYRLKLSDKIVRNRLYVYEIVL